MSRAFVKDADEAPEPRVVSKSESHLITAAGLANLERELATAQDQGRRAELQSWIDSAIVAGPPKDRDVAGFGASVTVSGAAETDQTYVIVGEREMNAAEGKITVGSPLGATLLGARVGEEVVWHRPAGDRMLRVRAISYDSR